MNMLTISLLNAGLFVVLSALMVIITHYIANKRFLATMPNANIPTLWETPAFLIRRAGLYAGSLLGLFAVCENIAVATKSAGSIAQGLTQVLLVESALGFISVLLFMFVALRSADWVILSKMKNDAAITNNNVAVAIVEGCVLLGTGFVAYGALLGEGHIASAWVFFLIGQCVFVLVSYALEYIIYPSHAAKTDIEKGCIPSGLIVGSMLIASALFVKNGIAGDFTGVIADTWYFLRLMGMQMAVFFAYLFLIEPVMLKALKLGSITVGGAAVRASVQIVVAVSIALNVSL